MLAIMIFMGSDLSGFVMRPTPAGRLWATGVGAIVVELPFDLALIPFSNEVCRTIGAGPDPYGQFRTLPADLAEHGRRLSAEAPLAYVAQESFGGLGWQEAVAWRGGDVALQPRFTSDDFEDDWFEIVDDVHDHAVNQVLRWFGVDRGDSFDEFRAVGFDQCRSTGDWYER
jgi:hypothetical protein